jgi:hypothetical protein
VFCVPLDKQDRAGLHWELIAARPKHGPAADDVACMSVLLIRAQMLNSASAHLT